MSPVYVPLVVLLFAVLDRFTRMARATRAGRPAKAAMLAVVAIWLLSPTADACAKSLGRSRRGAGGYNTAAWRESSTIDFVERLPYGAEGTIYTNAPEAVYILAGRPAELSPRRTYYRSSQTVNNIADLAGSWPQRGNCLLVWFERVGRSYLFTPFELESVVNLDTLAALEDGVVYRVSARQSAADSAAEGRVAGHPRWPDGEIATDLSVGEVSRKK
jgi:hypothetical protein